MTEEQMKEQISLAYAKAVAACAGVKFEEKQQDHGFDGTFYHVEYDEKYHRYANSGYNIDIQAKSTQNIDCKENKIIYDLRVKNYIDLIKTNIGTPRMLLLYELPPDKEEWLEYIQDGAILRKKAWWYSLKGLPEVDNKSTVRIKVPSEQIFTPDVLKELLTKVRRGEEIVL